jgi:hypothetical protein
MIHEAVFTSTLKLNLISESEMEPCYHRKIISMTFFIPIFSFFIIQENVTKESVARVGWGCDYFIDNMALYSKLRCKFEDILHLINILAFTIYKLLFFVDIDRT